MKTYAEIVRAVPYPKGGSNCYLYESQLFLIKGRTAYEILVKYYSSFEHITVNYIQE